MPPTHTTHGEHFGRNSISIPTPDLSLAGRRGILARIFRGTLTRCGICSNGHDSYNLYIGEEKKKSKRPLPDSEPGMTAEDGDP